MVSPLPSDGGGVVDQVAGRSEKQKAADLSEPGCGFSAAGEDTGKGVRGASCGDDHRAVAGAVGRHEQQRPDDVGGGGLHGEEDHRGRVGEAARTEGQAGEGSEGEGPTVARVFRRWAGPAPEPRHVDQAEEVQAEEDEDSRHDVVGVPVDAAEEDPRGGEKPSEEGEVDEDAEGEDHGDAEGRPEGGVVRIAHVAHHQGYGGDAAGTEGHAQYSPGVQGGVCRRPVAVEHAVKKVIHAAHDPVSVPCLHVVAQAFPVLLQGVEGHVPHPLVEHLSRLVEEHEGWDVAHLVEPGHIGEVPDVHYLNLDHFSVLCRKLVQNFGHLNAGRSARRHELHELGPGGFGRVSGVGKQENYSESGKDKKEPVNGHFFIPPGCVSI